MHTGPVPWKRVSLATQQPMVLQWRTRSSPNTVNVTVFRHFPVPGQMVIPQDVAQSCMVDATYPQSRGCTLGAHDTLRMALTPSTQHQAVGMLVSAMWVPNHIGKHHSPYSGPSSRMDCYLEAIHLIATGTNQALRRIRPLEVYPPRHSLWVHANEPKI